MPIRPHMRRFLSSLLLALVATTAPAQDLDQAWADFKATLGDQYELSVTEDSFCVRKLAELKTRVYLLRSTDGNLSANTVAELKALKAGCSFRWSWQSIEAQNNSFNFTKTDAQVAACRKAGVPYMIRIMCAFRSPRHSTSRWIVHDGVRYPVPWDDEYQRKIDRMLRVVCGRYQDATVVHVPWWKGGSEVMQAPGLTDHPEFTPRLGADWHAARVATIRNATSKSTRVSANMAPPGGKPWVPLILKEMETVRLGVVQANALAAKSKPDADWVTQIVEFKGAAGWQMLCASNQDRFGGLFAKAITLGETAGPLYYEVYYPDLRKAVEIIK